MKPRLDATKAWKTREKQQLAGGQQWAVDQPTVAGTHMWPAFLRAKVSEDRGRMLGTPIAMTGVDMVLKMDLITATGHDRRMLMQRLKAAKHQQRNPAMDRTQPAATKKLKTAGAAGC